MKICIYGAGAVGGYLGVRLAETRAEVSLVARGRHLAAMQEQGLTLLSGNQAQTVAVRCTDDAKTLGPQDYLILTVKAHATAAILEDLQPLLGPHTAVVTAQNGILWWYFQAVSGPLKNHHLVATDPGGRIWQALGAERAIGCVVDPSCELAAPGVVRHIAGTRFMLGEPDGSKSDRVRTLGEVLTSAGLKAPVRDRIRDDIWFKLLGNATFNPVSVLTRGTLEQIGLDPGVRAVIRQMMTEAVAVGTALGVRFPMVIEKRMDAAVAVGAHKTSMLQDFEQGKPLELDALVSAVVEMGQLVGVPTPTLENILVLVRLAVANNPRNAAQPP